MTCGGLEVGLEKLKLSISSLPCMVIWEDPFWVTSACMGKLTSPPLPFSCRTLLSCMKWVLNGGSLQLDSLSDYRLTCAAERDTQGTVALEVATRLVILGKTNWEQMQLSESTVCIQGLKCPKREPAGKGICGLLLSHKSRWSSNWQSWWPWWHAQPYGWALFWS